MVLHSIKLTNKRIIQVVRGLKPREPLSPTLFIIKAEVMLRALKALVQSKDYKMFGLPRGSPKVNHITFEDDMIILCKVELHTMQQVNSTLDKYERTSGQKVNKEKSSLYLHKGISQGVEIIAKVITRILIKEFPFTYLGCPIFHMRKRKVHNQSIIRKINWKLQGWKGKLLTYRGRVVLIKHVL